MRDVTFLTIVQKVLGKVEGKLLAVVTGNGQLTFQLALGSSELTLRERMLHHAVQLAVYQAQTAFHVVMVATEIDAPTARVAIAGHRTLDGIHQAVTLTERQV